MAPDHGKSVGHEEAAKSTFVLVGVAWSSANDDMLVILGTDTQIYYA